MLQQILSNAFALCQCSNPCPEATVSRLIQTRIGSDLFACGWESGQSRWIFPDFPQNTAPFASEWRNKSIVAAFHTFTS